jgi:hypothetical protein
MQAVGVFIKGNTTMNKTEQRICVDIPKPHYKRKNYFGVRAWRPLPEYA